MAEEEFQGILGFVKFLSMASNILENVKSSHHALFFVQVDPSPRGLGWVDLDLGCSTGPLGCTAGAVLPKQDSGTSHIQVNPTQSARRWVTLYCGEHNSTVLRRQDLY